VFVLGDEMWRLAGALWFSRDARVKRVSARDFRTEGARNACVKIDVECEAMNRVYYIHNLVVVYGAC
jgi:hypothetical protein